ncbi:hypothetical protein D3C72_2101380 [compost metagenome]
MIPEFGFAAEAAQFDHRQGEIKVVVLGLLHDGFIEFKRWFVLWGIAGNQPAVVADRNKYANFHLNTSGQ